MKKKRVTGEVALSQRVAVDVGHNGSPIEQTKHETVTTYFEHLMTSAAG